MLKLGLAIACVALPLIHQSQAAEPARAEPAVRRSTLLVSDIEKSIRFYEALGFSITYDKGGPRDPERPMALPLNVKPGASRLVIMKGRDPWIAMVGLLAYDQPKPPSNRIVADKIGAGDVILMIEVADAAEAHRRLVALGARILQEPKPFEATLGDGTPIKGINCFAVDPDGHVVELSQPTSKGR
ncbi:MAG: VOC family protein [Rhodospirillaceae bacterium]|nr:VOC family protein [Rhodospirillaceae bacterium]